MGNHFFAALNNLYGIRVESQPNTLSVDTLSVLGNTFIDHIANPIKLMGASNFNVNQNIFENFNSLGGLVKDQSAQFSYGDYSAAIFLTGSNCGYSTHSGSIKANLMGGSGFLPSSASTNYGLYGVYSACFPQNEPTLLIKNNTGQMGKGGALVIGDILGE